MTGPEHYAEAEHLLVESEDDLTYTDQERRDFLTVAQVHATLALTAATAYPAIVAYTGDEMAAESRGWANVTAPRRQAAS